MEALQRAEWPPEPDVSHLVTEDDTPVDSVFSEKQMRLLASILHTSWEPGCPFVVMANVGIFGTAEPTTLVPGVLVSLGVSVPEDPFPKGNRSYFVWRYGKAPDLVVEVVSNQEGGELEKAALYARVGVRYYVVFDPEGHLGERPLRAWVLHGMGYVPLTDVSWLEELGLGLVLWEGRFEDMEARWLRPCGPDRVPLPFASERVEAAETERDEERAARRAADAEWARERAARAEAEAAREAAEAETERLRQRLRDLGLEG